MPAVCTCGTQLVDDALFCHKCGKAQREIPYYDVPPPVEAPPPPPTPVVVAAPPRLSFRNPIALRIAFTVSLVAAMLGLVSSILIPILWAAAGWFAVMLYRRATGAPLTVRSGLQLGWITGVVMFALYLLMAVPGMVSVASKGGLGALFREQLRSQGNNVNDPRLQPLFDLLNTSSGQFGFLLIGFTVVFVIITLLSMAGGAAGAKFASRER